MLRGFSHILVLVIIFILGATGLLILSHQPKQNNPLNKIFDKKSEISPENAKEKLEVFPARLEDFLTPPKMYGIWPYGIKGEDANGHNEGHPGWDFELKKGSKLYAIADISIGQIHDGDKQTKDGQTIKVIEAYARLKDGGVGVVYHSVINIEKDVVEGATIKAGSVLAEVGYPISDDSAMIHFGIFAPNDRIGVCPSRYFSDELQATINKIVANSVDMKTGKPYPSACVGKINKDLYYKNFPDRVKYLEGSEEWE